MTSYLTDGGTGVTALTDNSNIVGFRNNAVMKHVFKGGGDAAFVGALTVGARVATTPPAGTIQWSGTHFQGYTGATWVDMDAAGATPTVITVAAEAADATCYPLFVTAATGNLGPKTHASFGFDAVTCSLGIGVAVPTAKVDVYATTTADLFLRSVGDAASSVQRFYHARTGVAALAANDWIGGFTFAGYAQTSYVTPAYMGVWAGGTYTDVSTPAYFTFHTTPVNSVTAVERLRIAPTGNILVGTADDDGTPATGRLVVQGTTNDGTTNIFVGRDSDAANVASLDSNGVWTAAGVALGAGSITMTGSLGATGSRLTKGWFTDLEVSNAIAGSVTGNAATVTAADEAADMACYLAFVTGSTGAQGIKTNAALPYNASTGMLSSVGMSVTGDGNASTPQLVNVIYGTGDPPTANTVPIGTIYLKHEA
jgi:hypothetical protein